MSSADATFLGMHNGHLQSVYTMNLNIVADGFHITL